MNLFACVALPLLPEGWLAQAFVVKAIEGIAAPPGRFSSPFSDRGCVSIWQVLQSSDMFAFQQKLMSPPPRELDALGEHDLSIVAL